MLKNSRRHKPLFKKILTVRKNVPDRRKLLDFKKKKWKLLKLKYHKKLKFFRKSKALDQRKYFVTKFARKGNSYKKYYRSTFKTVKKFRLYCANLRIKQIKRILKIILKTKEKPNSYFSKVLAYFESRLDIALVKAQFCPTIRSAQQLIKHNKVKVDGKLVKKKAYYLKSGNLISIDHYSKRKLNKMIIEKSLFGNKKIRFNKYGDLTSNNCWPHPPKYLLVNYRTFQIIFGNINQSTNFSTSFSSSLKLERIILSCKTY